MTAHQAVTASNQEILAQARGWLSLCVCMDLTNKIFICKI